MSVSPKPASQKYFYGRISRDESETILVNHGCQEGLFLLRESMNVAGNFALSICHQNRVHHYSIERQPDGMVMIQDGRKFRSPVELVKHHEREKDGFLTCPTIPCNRPPGVQPMAWPYVTMKELEEALLKLASQLGYKAEQLAIAFGSKRQQLIAQLSKVLHNDQPWFHGRITRDSADAAMLNSKHQDGKFLVRARDSNSYALSLSFQRATKHYKIDKVKERGVDKFAIEDGQRFDNLMDMIGHYHNKTDGLLCKLTTPCYRPDWKGPREATLLIPFNGILDEPEDIEAISHPTANGHATPFSQDDDPQKIYDSVPRTEEVFTINPDDLRLLTELGAGQFGSVMRGVYRCKKSDIPVAVKTLKQDNMPGAEDDIVREARMMAALEHRHIVRLFGLCKSRPIMLVMELAALGQLNKYLAGHKDMAIRQVADLMIQVADGMCYLESKNFVHRDLAARNVLLVNNEFAKISDFGMSKALGLDSAYYQCDRAGKWPLKWYAPECIYYFKFDSKSDVWSYGVTLWEAMSYGGKPYKGLRGQQILDLIETSQRLEKPSKCPVSIYNIMLKCWKYEKSERPTFREILELMRGEIIRAFR